MANLTVSSEVLMHSSAHFGACRKFSISVLGAMLTAILFTVGCGSSSSNPISTVAGTNVKGYNGDGKDATDAALNNPRKVVTDSSGNMYIADTGNNVVRKVSGGTITTFAGTGNAAYYGDGGAATSAGLKAPQGLAVDSSGNVYIADAGNHAVRMVSGGIITTIAGTGVSGYSGDGDAATVATLISPYGVAVDSSSNVYIADYGAHVVRKVSSGVITTVVGTGVSGYVDGVIGTSAKLKNPEGLAFDASGNLYIADAGNHSVRKLNISTGVVSTVAGNGNSGSGGDDGSAIDSTLSLPEDIALDSAGDIYIADANNNVIRKVTASTGIITTVAGDGTSGYSGDGGSATSAELYAPSGITLDSSGNLYIADSGNAVIRKVRMQ